MRIQHGPIDISIAATSNEFWEESLRSISSKPIAGTKTREKLRVSSPTPSMVLTLNPHPLKNQRPKDAAVERDNLKVRPAEIVKTSRQDTMNPKRYVFAPLPFLSSTP